MPEGPEGVAHYLTTSWSLDLHKDSDCAVTGLLADLTDDEAADLKVNTDLVQRLTPSCQLKRGTNGHQTFLLAEELRCGPSNPNPMPITSLKIQGVHHSVRALILDLGPLWLKLHYLTHTSVQVYSRRRWKRLQRITRTVRKFSFALAIECADFTLAFVSMDKLFQPIWAPTRTALGRELPYILKEYNTFVDGVVEWMEVRSKGGRMGLAAHAIRDAPTVWVGVGAYSINEIMFMAGIPMRIQENELFGCASRTARLCSAYWTLCHDAELKLPALLRRAWDDGLLAPDSDERKLYPETMLHIYGKQVVRLPSRMVVLANQHNRTIEELRVAHEEVDCVFFRSEWTELLPDPFEPSYIRAALESTMKNKVQSGHLIWPKEWLTIQEYYNLPPPTYKDKLSIYFCDSLDSSTTYIAPVTDVANLFSDLSERGDRREFRPFVMKTSKRGAMWSMIDNYPENSIWGPGDKFRTSITSVDPSQHIFSKKSTKNGVAIGPLEYAANGRVFKNGRVVKRVSVRGYLAPELSESDVRVLVASTCRKERIQRDKAKLEKQAQREGRQVKQSEINALERRKMTAAEVRQRDKRITQALEERRRIFADTDISGILDSDLPPLHSKSQSHSSSLSPPTATADTHSCYSSPPSKHQAPESDPDEGPPKKKKRARRVYYDQVIATQTVAEKENTGVTDVLAPSRSRRSHSRRALGIMI